MGEKPLDIQAGFLGGWNVGDEGVAEPNTYFNAINMRAVGTGEIVTRGGSRRMTAAVLAAAPVLGGFSWRKSDGTVQELMVANGHLFTATLDSGLGGLTGLVDRGGGLSTVTNHLPVFAHFRDTVGERVYIADGTATKLSKWTGAAFTAHAFGPAVALSSCWVYNGRLYAISGNDQILYYSGLNNGDSLGDVALGGGFLTIRAFGASRLVAGFGLGAALFLCHSAGVSIFRGTTADDITVDLGAIGLAEGIGVLGQQAIVKFDHFAYLLTADGVMLANEGGILALDQPSQPDPILRPIGNAGLSLMRENIGAAAIFSSSWFLARNPRFQEIWVAQGIHAGQYDPRVYNYQLKRWSGIHAHNFAAGAYMLSAWDTIDQTGLKQLLVGCSDGFVRVVDYGSDVLPFPDAGNLDDVNLDGSGGLQFPQTLRCRRLWGGRTVNRKAWRSLTLRAQLRSVVVTLTAVGQKGDSVAGTQAQTATVDSSDYPVYRYTKLPKASQYLDVTLSATVSEPPIRVAELELDGDVLPSPGGV